jgi:hypothetical protein
MSISSATNPANALSASQAKRFAGEQPVVAAPSTTDIVPAAPADVVTLQTTKPKPKRGILKTLLWPFTKLGQLISGSFKMVGGAIMGTLKGIGSAIGGFFKKQQAPATPQTAEAVVVPTLPETTGG